MDAAGIAERTWPPATAEANGRAPEPHPFADPTMTRAAREARAIWRRAAPDAWRCELEALYHYTPEYPTIPSMNMNRTGPPTPTTASTASTAAVSTRTV